MASNKKTKIWPYEEVVVKHGVVSDSNRFHCIACRSFVQRTMCNQRLKAYSSGIYHFAFLRGLSPSLFLTGATPAQ